jgi:hypothetical protein
MWFGKHTTKQVVVTWTIMVIGWGILVAPALILGV